MPNDTLVNARSPVTQKSSGTLVTGPDVCKTPTPGGPVPIPYPNIAKSSDLAKGSKTVKINDAPVCLKDSEFSTSIGDDAGTLKGIISNTHKGKSFPVMGSFDVKTEGKNVVRNADPFVGNNRNTLPAPIIQAQVTPAIIPPDDDEKCDYCKKKKHDLAKKPGNRIGSGPALRKNITTKIKDHDWYTGPWSLQAHHLICSEAMKSETWGEWVADFGYNIDCKENGVMLPYFMDLACQLHVPMHRSGHSAGKAEGVSYPTKIGDDIKEIGERIKSGHYCSNPQKLTDDLNEYSEFVLSQINDFSWTITADGEDYDVGGIGCAGAKSLENTKPTTNCPHHRLHNLTPKGSPSIIPMKILPLEIGK